MRGPLHLSCDRATPPRAIQLPQRQAQQLGAGVARGVRHELKNESGRLARMRTKVTPAGRLEEFLSESARAARDGLYNARNLPTGFRGATWIAEFAPRF
jgi:hypothetical protein